MTATLNAEALSELTSFAEELADISGKVILPHFRERIAVHNKHGDGGFDPVTEADRAAEEAIRRRIKIRYPSHGIMGEEHGTEAGASPFTWVIDPIDGTRAFMCGMAQWGTLIALNDGSRPVIGVLDQPYTKERWVSANGHTRFLHAHGTTSQLKTRKCPSLSEAVLSTTSPKGYFDDREEKAFWTLSGKARMTRFGGDCYAYGLLAMGFIDVIVEAGLKPWDVQALIPIIENAGGIVTSWEGGDAASGGRVIACGDPSLHSAVVEALGFAG
jgi:myo-inositol-1(or 4)-monophosphatase